MQAWFGAVCATLLSSSVCGNGKVPEAAINSFWPCASQGIILKWRAAFWCALLMFALLALAPAHSSLTPAAWAQTPPPIPDQVQVVTEILTSFGLKLNPPKWQPPYVAILPGVPEYWLVTTGAGEAHSLNGSICGGDFSVGQRGAQSDIFMQYDVGRHFLHDLYEKDLSVPVAQQRKIETIEVGTGASAWVTSVWEGYAAHGSLKCGNLELNFNWEPSKENLKGPVDAINWPAHDAAVAALKDLIPKIAKALDEHNACQGGDSLDQVVRRTLKALRQLQPGTAPALPAAYKRQESDRPQVSYLEDVISDSHRSPMRHSATRRSAHGNQLWRNGARVIPNRGSRASRGWHNELIAVTCPPWDDNTFFRMDEKLAPDVKRIIAESTEHPVELRNILLKCLYDPEVHNQVYLLLMLKPSAQGLRKASLPDTSVVFHNLSQKLRASDKLLRYCRGRDRYCHKEQEEEWKKFVRNGQLAFDILTTTLTSSLAAMQIAMPSPSKAVSFLDIWTKAQNHDPDIQKTLPQDMQALLLDAFTSIPDIPHTLYTPSTPPTLDPNSTLRTGPIWNYDITENLGTLDMSKSIGSAYASEAWQKWVTVHSNELLPEIKERIDGAATEGEWFDRLENERQKLGDTLVWHRATLARFNQIFKSNGWELDPPEDQLSHVLRTYLKHDYKEYVTARREVLRRLDATREQIILTGYYSGVAEYENTNP